MKKIFQIHFLLLLPLFSWGQTFGDDSGALIWELPGESDTSNTSHHGYYTYRWFKEVYDSLRPGDDDVFVPFVLYTTPLSSSQDTLVSRGFTGVSNLISRSYSGFPDSLTALLDVKFNSTSWGNAHGSNQFDYIERLWSNATISVATMESDTSGVFNGHGPGLDFALYHPCRCQSGSTPAVMATLAAIKDSLQDATGGEISWGVVETIAKESAYRDATTHPGGVYPNELNGYGIPDFGAAIQYYWDNEPIADPYELMSMEAEKLDSFPTLPDGSSLSGDEWLSTLDGNNGQGNFRFQVKDIWYGNEAIPFFNGIFSESNDGDTIPEDFSARSEFDSEYRFGSGFVTDPYNGESPGIGFYKDPTSDGIYGSAVLAKDDAGDPYFGGYWFNSTNEGINWRFALDRFYVEADSFNIDFGDNTSVIRAEKALRLGVFENGSESSSLEIRPGLYGFGTSGSGSGGALLLNTGLGNLWTPSDSLTYRNNVFPVLRYNSLVPKMYADSIAGINNGIFSVANDEAEIPADFNASGGMGFLDKNYDDNKIRFHIDFDNPLSVGGFFDGYTGIVFNEEEENAREAFLGFTDQGFSLARGGDSGGLDFRVLDGVVDSEGFVSSGDTHAFDVSDQRLSYGLGPTQPRLQIDTTDYFQYRGPFATFNDLSLVSDGYVQIVNSNDNPIEITASSGNYEFPTGLRIGTYATGGSLWIGEHLGGERLIFVDNNNFRIESPDHALSWSSEGISVLGSGLKVGDAGNNTVELPNGRPASNGFWQFNTNGTGQYVDASAVGSNGIFDASNDGDTIPTEMTAILTDELKLETPEGSTSGGFTFLNNSGGYVDLSPYMPNPSNMQGFTTEALVFETSEYFGTGSTSGGVIGISDLAEMVFSVGDTTDGAFVFEIPVDGGGLTGLLVMKDVMTFTKNGAPSLSIYHSDAPSQITVAREGVTTPGFLLNGFGESGTGTVYSAGTSDFAGVAHYASVTPRYYVDSLHQADTSFYVNLYVDRLSPDTITMVDGAEISIDGWVERNSLGFTATDTSAVYTGVATDVFTISHTTTFDFAEGSTLLHGDVYVNDVRVAGCGWSRTIEASGEVSVSSGECIVELSTDDEVNVRYTGNNTGSDDMIIQGASLLIRRQ